MEREKIGIEFQSQEHTRRRGATNPTSPPARQVSWAGLAGQALAASSGVICVGFISLPLLALLLRVPLDNLLRYLGEPLVRDALRLSILSSLTSLALILVFG